MPLPDQDGVVEQKRTQSIVIMGHDCQDQQCCLMNVLLMGSTLVEVNGELIPCVTIEPETAMDIIVALTLILKTKLITEG